MNLIVTRKIHRVVTEFYLFQEKRENIDKTSKRWRKWSRNQILIRKSVMQGGDISITRISCTQWEPSWLCIRKWVSLSKGYLLKGRGRGFLLVCSPSYPNFLPLRFQLFWHHYISSKDLIHHFISLTIQKYKNMFCLVWFFHKVGVLV